MNATNPTINELFDQLGLESDDKSINRFIERHRGLDSRVKLEKAPFWNEAQADFLRKAWVDDAEWAEVIDQLNNRLR